MYLLMLSFPDIDNVAMSLYDIKTPEVPGHLLKFTMIVKLRQMLSNLLLLCAMVELFVFSLPYSILLLCSCTFSSFVAILHLRMYC